MYTIFNLLYTLVSVSLDCSLKYSVMVSVVYFLFLLSFTTGSAMNVTGEGSDQTEIRLPCSKFFCLESCGIIYSIRIDSGKQ